MGYKDLGYEWEMEHQRDLQNPFKIVWRIQWNIMDYNCISGISGIHAPNNVHILYHII
jgi:hypothetical protein